MIWTRKGDCNGCGWCCQFVYFNVNLIMPVERCGTHEREYYQTRKLRLLHHGGEQCVQLNGQLWNPCQHHDNEAKQCKIYETRPQWCREFPTKPEHILSTPCSYYFSRELENGRIEYAGGDGSPYPGSSTVTET